MTRTRLRRGLTAFVSTAVLVGLSVGFGPAAHAAAPMADLGVAGGLGGAALLLGGALVLRRRRQVSQRELA